LERLFQFPFSKREADPCAKSSSLPVICMTKARVLRHDRELIRARLETAEAGTALKLQILALLKRQGPTPPKNHH